LCLVFFFKIFLLIYLLKNAQCNTKSRTD